MSIIMARWKCATAPATASRRWNVSRRRTVAEAQPQCRADGRSWVRRKVCDQGHWGGRASPLPLDRYSVRGDWSGGGGGHWGACGGAIAAEGGARSRPSTDPVLVLPADRDPMPRGGRWEGYPRRRSPLALARACHDRQAKRSYATAVKEMSSRMAEVARLVLQAHPEELPRRAGRSRAATRGPSQGLHLRRSELVRTAIPSTHP